jgi:hypothetical protein
MRSQSPPATSKNKTWSTQTILLALTVGCIAAIGVGRWLGIRTAQAPREAASTPPHEEIDTVAADALAHYLAKIQGQARAHESAFEQLQQQKVLTWNIRRPEELVRDRDLVHAFLDTNAQLVDGLQYGDDFIRAELNTAKVPAAQRDSILARHKKMAEPLLPLQMRVRHADQALGENALEILNLLDLNWGAWTRDEATGRLDFTNTITLAAFHEYADKLTAAAAEREEAQKELDQYLERNRETHPQ